MIRSESNSFASSSRGRLLPFSRGPYRICTARASLHQQVHESTTSFLFSRDTHLPEPYQPMHKARKPKQNNPDPEYRTPSNANDAAEAVKQTLTTLYSFSTQPYQTPPQCYAARATVIRPMLSFLLNLESSHARFILVEVAMTSEHLSLEFHWIIVPEFSCLSV